MPFHWESQFLTSQDGLKLHIRQIGDQHSTKTPILCLPGLSRNVDDFLEIGEHLAQEGRWVVALDSRGRGGSDEDPNWQNYNLQIELGDVLHVLETLKIEGAIFLGTSRGGLLTALMAMVKPGMVRASILNDIGLVIEVAGLARIKGYIGKLGQPASFAEAAAILKRGFGAQFPLLDDAAWDRYARRTWKQGVDQLVPRYDMRLMNTLADLDLTQPTPDLWPAFDLLKAAPMLIIRGELSDLLSVSTVETMRVRHGNALLYTVPQQGHAPILDGEDTLDIITRFVSTLP